MKTNYTPQQANETYLDYVMRRIQEEEGCNVAAKVTTVARSGMSRRIKFYYIEDNQLYDITSYFSGAKNTNGLLVRGCDMDMCFAALYHFYLDKNMDDACKMANHYQYIG